MVVTLDVSKLSGWLNADAPCQESTGGHTVRGELREAADGGLQRRCTQRAGEGLDCRLGIGHGDERTENMPSMVVTLEVSKLSGWLNADAYCRVRVERRAYGVVRCAEYREAGGGERPRCTRRAGEGSTADWEQGMGRCARRTCCPCL